MSNENGESPLPDLSKKTTQKTKFALVPRKFLFVSISGLIGDIAWHVLKEGNEVKYYIKSEVDREVADGFVPKVDGWRSEVDWADVIVFDDVLGHGTLADELRKKGHLVVGGTPYTDMLEDDRGFGQEELKKFGISIIPYKNFNSFDEAIEFVKANPSRYVIKPSGEAQGIKRLLFVGEEEDGKDVLQVLSDYKNAWADRIPVFQLQKRVNGVEVAVGAFFNGREFVYPINVNFEHKKLFPGNIGPSTGEMGCYDENTEVLTGNGWKFFKDLNHKDNICTLNPKNDNIEYHKPSKVVSFKHHKELISVQNQTLDMMVTLDHNMYVQSQWDARNKRNCFKFVKAKDLEHQCLIKRTGKWFGKTKSEFVLPSVKFGHYEGRGVKQRTLPEVKVPIDKWLKFFGIWLTDGYASNDKLGIAQKKEPATKKIGKLLSSLPFKFSKSKNEFYCYNKQLANYLKKFGKAPNKYVDNFIKQLDKRGIELFLEWFCLGDGTIMQSGHRIFYTTSKKLADDIQELLLKVGRVGVIKERSRPGKKWIVDHFANSSQKHFEIHERVKKLTSWIDKRDTKVIAYNKKVYCATVRNHIMFIRRNGKPYWCGNTSMFWSGPNKMFNQTLKKLEGKLAEEHYVGYIDLNCIVNSQGIYPLEFTARFGYPTISIQYEGMITPMGDFLYGLASGTIKTFKEKSGFQIGLRIVVPPFPFKDPDTFNVQSKDSVIFFKKPPEGIHIEDVKLVNGEWLITGSAGVALIVCGCGGTMKQTQAQVYNRVKNIMIPHMYYRTDIGDRWYEDSDKLHTWGYLREA